MVGWSVCISRVSAYLIRVVTHGRSSHGGECIVLPWNEKHSERASIIETIIIGLNDLE